METKKQVGRKTRASAPPRLVRVLAVESFKITALWTNGQTRVNDFEADIYNAWKDDPYLGQLADAGKFGSVTVEHGVFHWPAIQIDMSRYPGVAPLQPLDFDPDLAYQKSTLQHTFDVRPKLASYLRNLREGAGLTQEQLATKVGFRKSYISKIESGGTDIQLGTLSWILYAGFGLTPEGSPLLAA